VAGTLLRGERFDNMFLSRAVTASEPNELGEALGAAFSFRRIELSPMKLEGRFPMRVQI
jgi:hypothetical protein